MKRKVGVIDHSVINTLGIPADINSPIYISTTNIEHIKSKHPDSYQKYAKEIPKILANPDYIGINPSDNSIEYVKEYFINNEFVKVAVRVSTNGIYYVRSMYVLNNNRVKNFIKKGTLKRIKN